MNFFSLEPVIILKISRNAKNNHVKKKYDNLVMNNEIEENENGQGNYFIHMGCQLLIHILEGRESTPKLED